jgi:hypothetical protein
MILGDGGQRRRVFGNEVVQRGIELPLISPQHESLTIPRDTHVHQENTPSGCKLGRRYAKGEPKTYHTEPGHFLALFL